MLPVLMTVGIIDISIMRIEIPGPSITHIRKLLIFQERNDVRALASGNSRVNESGKYAFNI